MNQTGMMSMLERGAVVIGFNQNQNQNITSVQVHSYRRGNLDNCIK
ncbi:MAG: hypothetical protein ACXW1A_05270 [Nitrososphaeraceae archaeon]